MSILMPTVVAKKVPVIFLLVWLAGSLLFIFQLNRPFEDEMPGSPDLTFAGKALAQAWTRLKLTGRIELTHHLFPNSDNYKSYLWNLRDGYDEKTPDYVKAIDNRLLPVYEITGHAGDQVFLYKFHNRGRCKVCHDGENSTLGVLEVRQESGKHASMTYIAAFIWLSSGPLFLLLQFLAPHRMRGRQLPRMFQVATSLKASSRHRKDDCLYVAVITPNGDGPSHLFPLKWKLVSKEEQGTALRLSIYRISRSEITVDEINAMAPVFKSNRISLIFVSWESLYALLPDSNEDEMMARLAPLIARAGHALKKPTILIDKTLKNYLKSGDSLQKKGRLNLKSGSLDLFRW